MKRLAFALALVASVAACQRAAEQPAQDQQQMMSDTTHQMGDSTKMMGDSGSMSADTTKRM
jgi:hypothetical protein